MKKLLTLFLIPFMFSCTEIEELKPYYSTRSAAECEDLTYGDGLILDDCLLHVGGTFQENISLNSENGPFEVEVGNDDASSSMQVGTGEARFVSHDGANAVLISAVPDGIRLASNNGTNIYVTAQGVEISLTNGRRLKVTGLKTSTTGLTSGDLYKDSNGFVKQVP